MYRKIRNIAFTALLTAAFFSFPRSSVGMHNANQGGESLSTTHETDEMFDLLEVYDLGGLDDMPLGVAFDGDYFWYARRGVVENLLIVIDQNTGIIVQIINQNATSAWGIRDMCFDGQYIYGGWEGGLDMYDASTYQYAGTIPFPPGMSFPRANAYDPATDHFYCGNWGASMYEMDRSGSLVRELGPPIAFAVYALSWDDDDPNGPWLWILDGALGPMIYQLDPVLVVQTGLTFSIEPIPPNTTVNGAIGLDYTPDWDPQGEVSTLITMIFGNVTCQCAVYEMHTLGGTGVTVALTPYGIPIYIPATGGTFEFNIELTNTGTAATTFDVWTMSTLPNGSQAGPLLGPTTVTLAGGDSIDRDREQYVPLPAPEGSYTYDAYVGDYPDDIWDEDHFPFMKICDGDGFAIYEWSNYGADFDDSEPGSVMGIPWEITLSEPYPNPFNTSTSIVYTLPEAGFVNLKVYNITVGEVAVLADEYMPSGSHQFIGMEADFPAGSIFID